MHYNCCIFVFSPKTFDKCTIIVLLMSLNEKHMHGSFLDIYYTFTRQLHKNANVR